MPALTRFTLESGLQAKLNNWKILLIVRKDVYVKLDQEIMVAKKVSTKKKQSILHQANKKDS